MPTFDDGSPVRIVVIAASLGGVSAIRAVLADLPASFPVPIVVVQHRTSRQPNALARVLGYHSKLRVADVIPDELLEPGTVYVAPPDRHVLVTSAHRFAFMEGQRIKHVLSSANPLFESAAANYGDSVVAVVLTGTDSDASEGARAVKDAGGCVIAQDASTSESFQMPSAAIATGAVDAVLPLNEIGPALTRLVERS
jgi:two-component system chemotaxis response regulator CheB